MQGIAQRVQAKRHVSAHRRGWIQTIVVCAFALVCSANLPSQEISDSITSEPSKRIPFRLRATWGGGTSAPWQVRITSLSGSINKVQPLAIENDGGAALQTKPNSVTVIPLIARSYDGFDFDVDSDLQESIRIEITRGDIPFQPIQKELTLTQLFETPLVFELDRDGNRFFLERPNYDLLGVHFSRSHLIFDVNEPFRIQLHPRAIRELVDGTGVMQLSMRSTLDGNEVWQSKDEVHLNESGSTDLPIDVEIPMPAQEGPYEIHVTIWPKRLTVPLVRPKPISQRLLQVVVLDPARKRELSSEAWDEVAKIDPTRARWWEKFAQMPQWTPLPMLRNGPIGSQPVQAEKIGGRDFAKLAPGKWQVIPLPVKGRGQPHQIEIELPAGVSQQLVVAVLEPELGTRVDFSTVATGIVSEQIVGVPTPTESKDSTYFYRLNFWPNTKSPLLLISNPRSISQGWYGPIRVSAGPSTLTSLGTFPKSIAGEELPRSSKPKLIGPYLSKPAFADTFGVPRRVDSITQQAFDDWQRYYVGGDRLLQHLKSTHFNAATINVLSDGSGLYPSEQIRFTPKFDSGIYAGEGWDPSRKDVLELLFRQFDREGLKLIPALDLNFPLANLEAIRTSGLNSDGIVQVDASGTSKLNRALGSGAPTAFYNPLDERVQLELVQLVSEISKRYANHSSFPGLLLHWNTSNHFLLSGAEWGCDAATLKSFRAWLESNQAGAIPEVITAEMISSGEFKPLWLRWRSERMTQLAVRCREVLHAEKPDAELWIELGGITQSNEAIKYVGPSIRKRSNRFDELLLDFGIDLNSLATTNQVSVLFSQDSPVRFDFGQQRIATNLERSSDLQEYVSQFPRTSLIPNQLPQEIVLPGFLKQLGLSNEFPDGTLHPSFAWSSHQNRERWLNALTGTDANLILDKGLSLRSGQEAALVDLAMLFQHLPAGQYETVPLETTKGSPAHIVCRKLTIENETYFYIANPSPWSVDVEVRVRVSTDSALQPLSNHRMSLTDPGTESATLRVFLRPFDLAGGRINSNQCTLLDHKITKPGGVENELRQELERFKGRLTRITDRPAPLTAIQNTDFEEGTDGVVSQWRTAEGTGIDIKSIVGEAKSGESYLRLSSTSGVAWMRSSPFAPPETGRLSLSVWLKVPKGQPPTKLRLAAQAEHSNGTYYRFGEVPLDTRASGDPSLAEGWKQFVVHFDDIPCRDVSDLRIGFDLMQPGEVFIDRVELFDRFFDDADQRVLLQNLSTARLQLDNGDLESCQRFLNSYWANFLKHFDPQRVTIEANTGLTKSTPVASPASSDTRIREGRNVLDRVKDLVPKKSR